MIASFSPAIPEIFLLGMICVTLLLDLFLPRDRHELTYLLAALSLLVTSFLVFLQLRLPPQLVFHGMFILDNFAGVLKLFILIGVFFTLVYSRDYVQSRIAVLGEYYSLALLSTLGMMVLVSAHTLLIFYLGMELMAFPIYTMIALDRAGRESAESAIKYFVTGALASGIFLYGFSLLYGLTGQLDIAQVSRSLMSLEGNHQLVASFALVFVVVGLAFKFGAVPFHMWAPDVYSGSPTSMTLFIATAPKLAGLGFAIRVLVQTVPSLHIEWQVLLMLLSVLSMLIGNFAAIVQNNLRRMLAYSSIAHSGYMMLGLVAGSVRGFEASVFYMVVYLMMSLGAFGLITLMDRKDRPVVVIDDLKGLNHRNPWLAFMMLIMMFSLAGIPPLLGFFSKVAVLESIVRAHMIWLSAFAIGISVVGAYYYIRVVKVMYFDEPEPALPPVTYSFDVLIAISLNGLLVLFLGVFPSALFDLCGSTFWG